MDNYSFEELEKVWNERIGSDEVTTLILLGDPTPELDRITECMKKFPDKYNQWCDEIDNGWNI